MSVISRILFLAKIVSESARQAFPHSTLRKTLVLNGLLGAFGVGLFVLCMYLLNTGKGMRS